MRKLFIIGIIVLIGAIILGEKMLVDEKVKSINLKVAFPSRQAVQKYEPTNISLDFEYILLENIYSPLVELDQNGSIEPGIAEKTEWVGNELKLSIRPDLKTMSGRLITAEDVLFSLKRILVLSANTHGNFKDIVCPGVDLKSIEQECDGLRIEGNNVFIKAIGGKTFLLPMLTAIDFAIIPRSSVDPKTLQINNYAETSGIYYVEKQDNEGKVYLKMNPNHYRATQDIASEIVLVPTNKEDLNSSFNMLKNGLVDHLTTVDQSRIDQVIQFVQDHKDEYEGHVTKKIRVSYLLFTEKGMKELSLAEREFISSNIRDAFNQIYKNKNGFNPRPEFFPQDSEGSLTTDQSKKLAEQNKSGSLKLNKKFKLGLIKAGDLGMWTNPLSDRLPTAEMYREDNLPEFKDYKEDDQPHAVISATDTGFLEDISLVTYSLNAGMFGMNKSERQKWLALYMSNDNKQDRIKMLKQVHFDALMSSQLVPLMSFPYTALVRKPWKMELSSLYANNQLWRIKK